MLLFILSAIISASCLLSEPDVSINSLESFIRKLDDEYDAYMRIADKSAEAIIERYEWMFQKPLTLPSDYIDPREAIMRDNEYTASAVLKSIMDNLNAERLWGWQRWLQRQVSSSWRLV